MTFASTIEGIDNWGHWRVKYGTYTCASGDTGGNIDTGLGNVNCCILQPKGSSVLSDSHVVNETFPDLSGPLVTIVTGDNEDGYWLAIESQKITATYQVDETFIYDTTVTGGYVFAIGQFTEDDNDGTLEADLRSVMEKVEGIITTPKDTSVLANHPVINETFPIDGSAITYVCTNAKTYYFLAWGKQGGV